MIKKLLSASVFLAGFLFPSKSEAGNIRLDYQRDFSSAAVELRYDYLSWNDTSARMHINEILPFEARNNLEEYITGAGSYADFISSINGSGFSSQDKIFILAVLGDVAGQNYDYSMPFREVSSQQLFSAIQQNISNNEIVVAGAICGGIHDFLRNTARSFGLPAVTYFGRNIGGGDHVLAAVLGDTGFVHFNYGDVMTTRTFNFYRSLVLADRVVGNSVFSHDVQNGDFLFRYYTPDGRNFFRFAGFNPDLDVIVDAVSHGVAPFNEGAHVVLGNTELSGSVDARVLNIFEVAAKAGRVYGHETSALSASDWAECVFRARFSEKEMYFDGRGGIVYGVFEEQRFRGERLFFLFDVLFGDRFNFNDVHIGFDGRVFFAGDMNSDDHLLRPSLDGSCALSAGYGPVAVYLSGQIIQGYDNVSEQNVTVHVGDAEVGILYKTSLGTVRLAGRIQPEAFVGRAGFENSNFSIDARYGVGRFYAFTPDFFEARARGRFLLSDSLSLEGSFSARHEQWLHGEQSLDGSLSGQMTVDF